MIVIWVSTLVPHLERQLVFVWKSTKHFSWQKRIFGYQRQCLGLETSKGTMKYFWRSFVLQLTLESSVFTSSASRLSVERFFTCASSSNPLLSSLLSLFNALVFPVLAFSPDLLASILSRFSSLVAISSSSKESWWALPAAKTLRTGGFKHPGIL